MFLSFKNNYITSILLLFIINSFIFLNSSLAQDISNQNSDIIVLMDRVAKSYAKGDGNKNVKSYISSNCHIGVISPMFPDKVETSQCVGYVKVYVGSGRDVITIFSDSLMDNMIAFIVDDGAHGDDVSINVAHVLGMVIGHQSDQLLNATGDCSLTKGDINCNVIRPTNGQYYIKYNVSGKDFTIKSYEKPTD